MHGYHALFFFLEKWNIILPATVLRFVHYKSEVQWRKCQCGTLPSWWDMTVTSASSWGHQKVLRAPMKEGRLLGKSLTRVHSKSLEVNPVRLKIVPEAHGNISEGVKHCFRCATQHQTISFKLVLLMLLLESVGGYSVDFWLSRDLPKADWNTSCISVFQNKNILCSYPLGAAWDAETWWEWNWAKKTGIKQWGVICGWAARQFEGGGAGWRVKWKGLE